MTPSLDVCVNAEADARLQEALRGCTIIKGVRLCVRIINPTAH